MLLDLRALHMEALMEEVRFRKARTNSASFQSATPDTFQMSGTAQRYVSMGTPPSSRTRTCSCGAATNWITTSSCETGRTSTTRDISFPSTSARAWMRTGVVFAESVFVSTRTKEPSSEPELPVDSSPSPGAGIYR
jgi:hypothetical protein